MTSKEKCKELVDKFSVVGLQQRNEGIQCALIAVEEILNAVNWHNMESDFNYWQSVKTEIEKL
jgi:hypothetical protein